MQISLKLLKSLVKEGLEDDEQKKISDAIVKFVDDGLDTDEAVNKYIKNNPNTTEQAVATALKSHPVSNVADAAFIKENKTVKVKRADFNKIIEEEVAGFLESLIPHEQPTQVRETELPQELVNSWHDAIGDFIYQQFQAGGDVGPEMPSIIQALRDVITTLEGQSSEDDAPAPAGINEGNEVSRMITRLELVLGTVEGAIGYLDEPQGAAIERLERAVQIGQELWEEMHNLLGSGAQPGADAEGYSQVAGTRPMQQEADEGGPGVHDIMNMPDPEMPEPTGNPKEDALRAIVASHSRGKVEGQMVDAFSASAIVQVLDALGDENKAKYIKLPVNRMAEIAFKLMK